MTNKQLIELLNKLDACREAVAWVGDRNLQTAWRECENAEWMLWLACKMQGKPGWPTNLQVMKATCACARRGLKFLPLGEDRPRLALDTVEAYAEAKASLDELKAAKQGALDALNSFNSQSSQPSRSASDSCRAVLCATESEDWTTANAPLYVVEAEAEAEAGGIFMDVDNAAWNNAKRRAGREITALIRSILSVPNQLNSSLQERVENLETFLRELKGNLNTGSRDPQRNRKP